VQSGRIMAVTGDPTQDVGALWKVTAVWKGGKWVER
jgi:hypothetical protein